MATERTPVDGLIEQDPEEAKDVSITVENPDSVAIETEANADNYDLETLAIDASILN